MFKKIILSILCLLFSFNIAFAIQDENPQKEVKKFIKEHNKALSNHDSEKLKTFYDENFISADGFKLEEMAEILQNSTNAFKNLKYNIKIDNIIADSAWAIVQMREKTTANIYPNDKKEKSGKLDGVSSYIVYLKKINREWKIIQDKILAENTSLKYGSAKKMKIDLKTPLFIENGKDYNLSLKIKKPQNIIALASISKEEIKYPAKNYEEKFRKTSQTGDLERLVCANDKNKNEYALASVGLTEVTLNKKEKKVKIKVVGVAYLIKRINMIENKKKDL